MIKWCNDHIYVPIYPEGSDIAVWHPIGALPDTPNPDTGKSYKSIWENQHRILKEALEMNLAEALHADVSNYSEEMLEV